MATHRAIRAETPQELTIRLRITADAIPDAPRPPINLMLAVDTSGSMEGEAIDDARAAALALVDLLQPGDAFGLVVFHSRAEVLVPSTRIESSTVARLREEIRGMKAAGTTDLAGGLSLALEQIRPAIDTAGVNRVVLVSDGVPNDPSPIAALASTAGGMGVSITALGLGLEYDETLLTGVAQASGGAFHFVEESAMVAQVFRDEVLRLERIAAVNTHLSLRPGPGVLVAEVVGHPVAATGGLTTLPLGQISEGEVRDVFVRLHVPPHADGASIELLDAVLGFEDAVAGSGRHERTTFVGAKSTTQAAVIENGRAPEIELAAAQAGAAAAMVNAIASSRAGALPQARAELEAAEAAARADAQRFDDELLRMRADEMVELKRALPAVQPAAPIPGAPSGVDSPEPFPESAPATVRRSHGRAMRALQPRTRGVGH
jgi:Ca-activated chloride channel family protein